MGEIADMMVDGTLDMETGEYIGDENMELFGTEAPGFPRRRGDPSPLQATAHLEPETVTIPAGSKVCCPECGKRVKPVGIWQHLKDAHGVD